ncbi:Uncharacterized protein BM_BM1547 [Brugia malayi]|uniref:Bm1547 n=1 Tax=Brugia malayi TaxID=6279 RepID=A0A0J9Y892_BRUMA|nr:Uncharacterized protein BM_BM1547 [Brugia malayi]CDQ04054.1 Bm1547 [Brugia malayi]VIO94073.1 Uncharacterized protein BM_BM1547 [Brugia malayi]
MNECGGTYRSTIDRFNTIDVRLRILIKNENSCEFMVSHK